MKRIVIYPYKFASESARKLASILRDQGYPCIRAHPDRKYTRKESDLVINWGSQTPPVWNCASIINDLKTVTTAGNKLLTYDRLTQKDINIPNYTTEKAHAQQWLSEGCYIVERELLRASGGKGIILHTAPDSVLGDSPLYTMYVKKKREYRVHVADGEVIDWQQKMNKKETSKEDINYQIRNHSNGWIFARDSAMEIPEEILDSSVRAVQALGLTFGAVDCGWNERHDRGVIYEVNTAPGLEGQTLKAYSDFIINNFEDYRVI